MQKVLLLSVSLTSILFFGCGSSPTTKESFSISTKSTEYDVVEGMKKDIQIIANRENVTFQFVDKSQAPITELNQNNGILVYRSPESSGGDPQTVVVEGLDEDTGDKSSPLSVTFETVDDSIIPTIEVLQTGADDGGFGKNRVFSENGDGDIVDSYGNIWAEQSDTKLGEAQTYLNAFYNKCEILKLTNQNSNWRLPTKDEALNLINFSKVTGQSMLDDVFVERNQTYTWVQSDLASNDKHLVSFFNGLTFQVSIFDAQQEYTSKCINAPLVENKHVISTDRYTDYTHDFTTGLQWSPITEMKRIVDDVNQTAAEYCTSYEGGSGWRLPNINELRSVVENDTVSSFIRNGSTILVSSTPFNDSNSSAKNANYVLYIKEDNTVDFGVQYVDELYGITCVKNRE